MNPSRMPRVDETVKVAIAEILQHDVTDPRIGFATVSRVEVTKDLRHAVVRVSFLNDDEASVKEAMEGLEGAKGFIKRELGQRVRLKYMPDLHFRYDGSAAYAERINELLRKADVTALDEEEEAPDEPEA